MILQYDIWPTYLIIWKMKKKTPISQIRELLVQNHNDCTPNN